MQKASAVFQRMSRALVVLVLFGLLSSCSYYAGNEEELVPWPADVVIMKRPTITDAQASFVLVRKDDSYRLAYGWCCHCSCKPPDPQEPPPLGSFCPTCPCCYWCCWRVWDHTDVWGDIILTLQVNDPSNDLDQGHSPAVYVQGSEPGPSGGAASSCTLNVEPHAIPIGPGEITGVGSMKTVKVRIQNVTMRFDGSCGTFSAVLPLSIQFADCGITMTSMNTSRSASLLIPRP